MKKALRVLIAYSLIAVLICNQSITSVLANSDYPLEEIRSSYSEQKMPEPRESEKVATELETTEPEYAPEVEIASVPPEIIPTIRSTEDNSSTFNESIKTSSSHTVLEAVYDDQAPSKPMELKCESKTQTQVNLVWTASTDNVGVKGYEVYRNGSKIVTVSEAVYTDNSVDKNKYYKYYVVAFDEAGNKSEPSNEIEVNTFQSIDINSDMVLQSDMEVGNLSLNSGNLNLNGHKLVVNGSLIQTDGNLTINKGELIVKENYSLTNGAYGRLIMTNINDYVSVEGNFYVQGYNSHNGYLMDGVLEVKGDFTQRIYSYGYAENFIAAGSHRVILSGDKKQTVDFSNAESMFNILEIKNYSEEGIVFKTPLNAAELIDNGCRVVFPNGDVLGWTLTEDEIREGDLYLAAGELNLNGQKLVVKGDLV